MLIDPPVGTLQERLTGQVWPGQWIDSTPFGMRYQIAGGSWARHTGADLNLNAPVWNSDAGAPIYAVANGVVTFSDLGGGSWGWIIVIEHEDDNGQPFYSRYGHVNHIQYPVVRKSDSVTLGGVIAQIGNADGFYGNAHHLHFDISHTRILKTQPKHWPGDVTEAVMRRNYSPPKRFILENRMAGGVQPLAAPEIMKVIATSIRIRPQPDTSQAEIGWVRYGDELQIIGDIPGSGYHFAELLKINNVDFVASGGGKGYVAREYLQA